MNGETRLREVFEQAVAAYERAEPGNDGRTREIAAGEAFAAAYTLSRHYHRAGDASLETLWYKRAGEWGEKDLEAIWDEEATMCGALAG